MDTRFGRPRVVLHTKGGRNASQKLRENERTDWFHSMVSEGVARDVNKKTMYDKYSKKRRAR